MDDHDSMAHVEEPTDAWEQRDERGSPENLAAGDGGLKWEAERGLN
jgi:hypothetical protein